MAPADVRVWFGAADRAVRVAYAPCLVAGVAIAAALFIPASAAARQSDPREVSETKRTQNDASALAMPDLPEWTTQSSFVADGSEVRVLKTFPYFTPAEAERELDRLISETIAGYAGQRISELAGSRLVISPSVVRQRWMPAHIQAPCEFNYRFSAGLETKTMYCSFAQLRLDADLDQFLAEQWKDQSGKLIAERQQRTLTRGGIVAAAAILCIGLVHMFLRLDFWTRGMYSRRLFTLNILGIAAIAATAYFLWRGFS